MSPNRHLQIIDAALLCQDIHIYKNKGDLYPDTLSKFVALDEKLYHDNDRVN